MNLGAAIASGAVMGFLLSVLGGGGSLFIVPVLLFGFGTSVSNATGTSLVVVFAGAAVSAVQHFRAGRMNKRVLWSFGPASMIGAAIGALLHGTVSDRVALDFFCALLLLASLRMLFGKTPEPKGDVVVPLARTIPLGFLLGVVTGFAGVGGGFLIVPVLVFGAHVALKEAVGTSTGLIALSCVSGAITCIAEGHVDVELATAIGAGAIGGALAGAPLSGRLPEKPMRIGFGVLVLVAAVYTFVKARSWV
jgi:uncharacterized protein